MPAIGSSSRRRKLPVSKFSPKCVRIDFSEQLQDLIRGEIDVVFHRQLDAVIFGDLDSLLEHFHQRLDLGPCGS